MVRRKKEDENPFDDVDGSRNLELEALKIKRRGMNPWKILIVGCVVATALSFLISAQATQSAQDAASSALSAQTVDRSGPGKGVALRAVNSYLRSEQTPFPKGVEDLSWDSAAKVSSGKDGEGKMVDYWSHRFTFVALPDKVTRKVAQLVSVSDGVTQAVGSPSLLPLDAGSVSAGQVAAPANYTAIQQSDTLKNVVDSWAEAYVGGDRSKLTVLVADPDAQHVYLPADLGKYQSSTVDWAVKLGDRRSDWGDAHAKESGKWAAVGVTVSFTPRKASDKNVSTVSTSLTLLVANPSSGSAHVVDWEPAGVLTGLKPYANAVDSSVAAQSSSDSSSDSSSSSSASSSPSADSSADSSSDSDSSDGGE